MPNNTLSLPSYLVFFALVLLSQKFSIFGDFVLYFLLVFTLLLIRDIILIFGVTHSSRQTKTDWYKITTHREAGKLSILDILILINRVILFPTLLIAYIALILMKQLDISPLMIILTSIPTLEYSLLGLVAFSGLLTVWRESLDTLYTKKVRDPAQSRRFVLGSILLALLGVALISRETASLGYLSLPISIISGLLIFLIGTLLLEEEEEGGKNDGEPLSAS